MAVAPDITMLRCPATRAPLRRDGGDVVTADAGRRYPVVGGVPVLLPAAGPFAAGAAAVTSAPRPWLSGLAARLVPKGSASIGSPERFRAFAAELHELRPDGPARVLVVGGGELGVGVDVLLRDPLVELVETDVYLGPRVQVVCDAHELPFPDASFDGVVAQAVLEHVLDPQRVVAELHRVLRADGLVYAETPFMQQVHEGPYDFTRWSERGHRRLFRMFAELDSGVAVGPASALVWSLRYFARSLPRSVAAARAFDKVATAACFWLKHLDRVLAGHPGAVDAAGGVYFLGRRAEHPVDDRDVVAGYRGTLRCAAAARGHVGG